MNKAMANYWWVKAEWVLCVFLVGAKLLLLWRFWNQGAGFDWRAHAEMIPAIRFFHPNMDLYATFYNYHPPLAFLLARIFFLAGVPVVASIQIVSTAAMLVSFFFVRATLKLLKFLSRPDGIAFLYLTYSIPLNVFLSYSVNLDVIILACASGALYCSVEALQLERGKRLIPKFLAVLSIALFLAAGIMTKFSGVLFLPIPILVFYFFSQRMTWQRFAVSLSAIFFACSFAFPYYYLRYHQVEGVWFPSNTNHFDAGSQKAARAERDKDRLGFLVNLMSPTRAHHNGPQFRDLAQPRLSDTWKDVWVMDQWIIERLEQKPSSIAQSIGARYFFVAPILLVGGFMLFLSRMRMKDKWQQWGRLLLTLTVFLVAVMIAYIYQNPWGGSLANKAMYIAPATWGIGFLLSQYFYDANRSKSARTVCILFVLGFVAINHLLPVY